MILKAIILGLVIFLAPVFGWAQSISLSWTDLSNEDGFDLERADVVFDSTTGVSKPGSFSSLFILARNENRYVDTEIILGKFYCYRVFAFIVIATATPPKARTNSSNVDCGASASITLGIQ